VVNIFGPVWALLVGIAARLLTEKLTTSTENDYSYKVLAVLRNAGLANLLAAGKRVETHHLLTRVCDRDITLAGLGLTLPDGTL
jgi:hypothetical protein